MRSFRGSGYTLMVIAAIHGCGKNEQGQQAAAPPPEATVSQVVSRDVTDFGEFTGRTDSVQTVDIRARVTGYLDKTHFDAGQEVKQGELLYEIDPRPFQAALQNAEGQKAQWQAKLARAQADVQRYEKLVPTGAATPQDLDKAKADMGEATAAIQSADAIIATAKLDLDFAQIKSPLDGQISRSIFSEGNLIRADSDVLTTIVSLNPIYVYFDVSERDLLALRSRSRAARPPTESQPDVRTLKIPVKLALANEQGYPHEGVINFADNRVDPSTGTIRVRGVFDNSSRFFKPGLFARVRISTSEPYRAILVAERAIGIDQGVKYVLTVDDKNIVDRRFVELGSLQDDGLRVITAGLKPEEWVVVNGLQRARPGKPVTPQRTEMPKRPRNMQEKSNITTQSAPTGATAAPTEH